MKTNETPPEKDSIKQKCGHCPYSTTILERYKQHVKTHSSEKPFKCPECPYRANWKGSVKTHLTHVHTSQPLPFPCSESGCNYATKMKSDLSKHSKIHLDEKSLFCSHSNCNYATNYKHRLSAHTRIHTGEKPFVCQFESCSFAAAQRGQLVDHFTTHTKEKPYKCPEPNCKYSTSHQGKVKTHQLTHEPKEGKPRKLFSCSNCEFNTKYKSALTVHLKRKHSDAKPFACLFEFCDFRCKSAAVLSNHLKTHSEERRYKCELCPFRGKTRSTVSMHLKNVHSDLRSFKCKEPKCNHASKTSGDLRRHFLTHNPEKKYTCSFSGCDYRSIGKTQVMAHEYNIHSEEKKAKCPLCDYSCKTKSQLSRHMRIHTKEEPYKCKQNDCGYQAKSSEAVKQHEKRRHPHISKGTK